MKRIIITVLFSLAVICAHAQTGAINGFCDLGGKQSTTSSLNSSNYLQGVIPHCTITVYLTGTTNLATIYQDTHNTTLANPFKAKIIGPTGAGQWIFWAAINQGYDVVMSGGDTPLTYPNPVTLTDLFPSSQFIMPAQFLASVNGTPLAVSGSENFVDSSRVTVNNPGATNQIQFTVLPDPGCQGTLVSDVTSTDCGTGNQASNTGTAISTFGYTNVLNNFQNDVTAIGTNNLNQNFGTEVLAGGSSNFTDTIGTNHRSSNTLLALGWFNGQHDDGVASSDEGGETFVGEGNGTDLSGTGVTQVAAVGGYNIEDIIGADELVAMGDSNLAYQAASNNKLVEAVALGDNTCAWSSGVQPTGQNGDDWVCIGDGDGLDIHPGSVDVVLIGDGAGAQAQAVVSVTPVSDVIAIGDASAKFNQGNDEVAIGNQALSAQSVGAGVGVYNRGNENIAIGHFPLVANTTGTQNTALGGYAGSDGYAGGTSFGNSNKTGSHNTWIGYDAGPGTTSQLSNTIALGYQAHNSASNQTAIGNSSITSLKVYGCPSGQIALDDGSGTCVSPGGSGTVTSVGLSFPGTLFSSVTNSPVTTSGTLTPVATTPAANLVLASPTSGGSGAYTFRSLVTADIPASVALLASPTFTGVPAAPTATGGTSTTQLATTAFVQAAIPALMPNQSSFYVNTNCSTSSPNCLQIYGDAQGVIDATSTSTTTVTCPNSDCNFVAGDVGKVVWATTQSGAYQALTYATVVCPQTTIATVNNAQSITLNATCTANGTGNVVLVWGHDDGPALNTLYTVAGCSVIHFSTSSKMIMTSRAMNFSATGCPIVETGLGAPLPYILGDGFGGSQTTFVMTPNFVWSGCTANADASNTRQICFGGTTRGVSNIQIWGNGLTAAANANCAIAANKVLLSTGGAGIMYGDVTFGSCAGESGHAGIEMSAYDGAVDLSGSLNVGQYAFIAYGGQEINLRANDFQNAYAGSFGSLIDGGATVFNWSAYAITNILIQGNSTYHSQDTVYVDGTAGATALMEITSGSTFISDGDQFTGTAVPGLKVDAGAKHITRNTIYNGNPSITNAGFIYSEGGNQIATGIPTTASTGIWSGQGTLVGTCRGTATGAATIGLYGLGQWATANCTSTVVNLGVPIQVPISGSIFELVVTATHGGVNSSDGVVKVLKNGVVNASFTCTLGTGTFCTNPYFDTPVAGDTYSVEVVTQTSSTLANITATLIAW